MGTKSSRQDDANDEAIEISSNGEAPSEDTLEPAQMSYYQMFKVGYQELVNAIIRPPRCEYDISQLGPNMFNFCTKPFTRRDFTLRNSRDLEFSCSMWEPVQRPNPVLPCVIYMHGNSSARLEAIPQLGLVLSLGATFITFDFCGSGVSEGEYVSLGYYEKDDLQCVIEHLREAGRTSTIALWGRSMGAATALLHGERDPSIAGMILDSPFADLQQLAEEMVDRGRQQGLAVPGFVVRIALRWIRSSVQKQAMFDIRDLSPIQHADKCFIPAMFVAAENDDFVPPRHGQQIFEKYAGDKNIILVEGDHNSQRPRFMFDSASIFLTTTLQVPSSWILEGAQRMTGLPPWFGDRSDGMRATEEDEDLEDMTLDQVLALSIMDMGMTTERQAEVRQALYTMLGDRQGLAAPTAQTPRPLPSSSSASASTTRPAAIVSPSDHSSVADNGNSLAHSAKESGVGVGVGSTSHPPSSHSAKAAPTTSAHVHVHVPRAQSFTRERGRSPVSDLSVALGRGAGNDVAEWTCSSCTLMNVSSANACAACGQRRSTTL
mmetsp:Transcript_32337/g.32960  ORF Transcript_32337/g.32960 Transcript_32337/m.32960 type:complete len:547 (-) Transcript_32337:425-2065(-)|eukprot:CAMPEP_0182423800 /NCGR_PEP_ID=MMETSP1167-20130531/9872_1 /TAXON_ID=2988 /ORGANISM="Mallomonas Sp, Strain CCMP3275" /LENGTH=546 /DNA_ID=CAMNT_0024603079 /DNA_START=193 /DNA_END=1833 /DNA_ORIENTATION=+